MVERRYGRIINICSLSSFVAIFEVAAYAASKSAVASLTKSLAIEWAPHGVCVNGLVPGVFRTALNASLLDGTPRGQEFLMRTPAARFGELELAAHLHWAEETLAELKRLAAKQKSPAKRRKENHHAD